MNGFPKYTLGLHEDQIESDRPAGLFFSLIPGVEEQTNTANGFPTVYRGTLPEILDFVRSVWGQYLVTDILDDARRWQRDGFV